MKIIQFLEDLTRVEEAYPLSTPATRRASLGRMGRVAIDFSKVALPFGAAFAAASPAAQAQGNTRTPIDVFNFALLLEYLESEFYQRGLGADGLIAEENQAAIAQIGEHEDQHVAFLQQAITANNGTPIDKPEFDFTAGGTFADVFSNPATFLAVANALEDTGVRAYKGQAGFLVGTGDLLQAALQIHSVEARHAAIIRRMRGKEAWIPFADNSDGTAVAPVYEGEENVTQLGQNASADNLSGGTSAEQVTEAYDEPLSTSAAGDIANLFIES